jgi:hypothetical protein
MLELLRQVAGHGEVLEPFGAEFRGGGDPLILVHGDSCNQERQQNRGRPCHRSCGKAGRPAVGPASLALALAVKSASRLLLAVM